MVEDSLEQRYNGTHHNIFGEYATYGEVSTRVQLCYPMTDISSQAVLSDSDRKATIPEEPANEVNIAFPQRSSVDWKSSLENELVPNVTKFMEELAFLRQAWQTRLREGVATREGLLQAKCEIETTVSAIIKQAREISDSISPDQEKSIRPILRIIAHELGNNLAVCASWFGLANSLLQKGDKEKAIKTLDFVERLSQRAVPETTMALAKWAIGTGSAIEQGLQEAGTSKSNPTFASIEKALRHSLDSRKLDFHVQYEEALGTMRLPIQLYIVLNELVRNAKDMLGDREGAKILLDAQVRSNQLILTVDDNGPGIAVESANEIFKRGVTTKAHGTGQGLALNLWLVQDVLGGKISAGTSDMGGARFEVAIPLASKVAA